MSPAAAADSAGNNQIRSDYVVSPGAQQARSGHQLAEVRAIAGGRIAGRRSVAYFEWVASHTMTR